MQKMHIILSALYDSATPVLGNIRKILGSAERAFYREVMANI